MHFMNSDGFISRRKKKKRKEKRVLFEVDAINVTIERNVLPS